MLNITNTCPDKIWPNIGFKDTINAIYNSNYRHPLTASYIAYQFIRQL